MGSGKFDNKHGVGIMLNKRWTQRIIDTEYTNERAITTTILVNRQHIKLMSVYFHHSKYADHYIEKIDVQNNRETHGEEDTSETDDLHISKTTKNKSTFY